VCAAATVQLKGGQASFQTATLGAGAHSVKAVFNGGGNFATSSGLARQAINRADTKTTLSSSKPTSGVSEAVTFTATVAPVSPGGGVPGGSVSFFLDGATKAAKVVTLSGGTASWSTSWSAPGTHTVHAIYSPGANYNASQTGTSPSWGDLTQTVLPATKTTLASSGVASGGKPYSLAGGAVTFTAKVVAAAAGGPTPTGTVTFFVDGVAQSAGLVSFDPTSGLASFTASVANGNALAAGAHTVTAGYSGDANYAGSSASLTQVVQAVDHLKAAMSTASPALGAAFSITVTAYDASGNVVVALEDVGTLEQIVGPAGGVAGLGSASVVNGRATFTGLSLTQAGAYRLRAHLYGLTIDVTFSSATVGRQT
jgi:hypothetical protein